MLLSDRLNPKRRGKYMRKAHDFKTVIISKNMTRKALYSYQWA